MSASAIAAKAKLIRLGVLRENVTSTGSEPVVHDPTDVQGEAQLRLKAGGQIGAVWAVTHGQWLHYVDEDGVAHTTGADNVADVAWG